MKILLITSEEWNDYVYGNGVLTNWFTGFDAEFAQIYTSPGLPINNICDKYFQITDSQMVKSIMGCRKAGGVVAKVEHPAKIAEAMQNAQRKGIYGVMKKISMTINAPVIMLRDFIWTHGRYDEVALKKFIDDFNPDIVFCPRYLSPKIMRLEKIVSTMTEAPFVAFTGDDDASLPTYGNWLSRLRKRKIHNQFKEHVSLYKHFFTFSEDQAKEYAEEYGVETSTLMKSGDFDGVYNPKPVGKPIRLVYAGRLYCNRWKSLSEIGKALQIINNDGIRMVLDIYTMDSPTCEQTVALSEEKFIYMKGSVTPSRLKTIYGEADIALHVESLDEYYRMVTRVSFSTKIIDLMASTCAIMAICWNKHAGYQYLKKYDAAFCIADYSEILPQLKAICDNPALVQVYAKKAYECGKINHSRETIHQQIRTKFNEVIAGKGCI